MPDWRTDSRVVHDREAMFKAMRTYSLESVSAHMTQAVGHHVVLREALTVSNDEDNELEVYGGKSSAMSLQFGYFSLADLYECAIQVVAQDKVPELTWRVEEEILVTEGLPKVQVDISSMLGDWSEILSLEWKYPFNRAAKAAWTVAEWKRRRFSPAFPLATVEVFDWHGAQVHGGTKLGTVRRAPTLS